MPSIAALSPASCSQTDRSPFVIAGMEAARRQASSGFADGANGGFLTARTSNGTANF